MKKTVYFIPGDGIGQDLWPIAQLILDSAVQKVCQDKQAFEWKELLAGAKALAECGELLPEDTVKALQNAELAIKGPLGTPVGKGFRSLNVTLRQTLDLYACIRPIRHFKGIESPLKHPELVNMTIFRENTEDVYAGIEYKAGSLEAKKLLDFLRDELGASVDPESGVGIKPMTARGSKRLIRKAILHAQALNLPSVTLMHKGNIMKFTEGAFREWGYELVREEFYKSCMTEEDARAAGLSLAAPLSMPEGRTLIKDRIADALFQDVLLYPRDFHVIATPNLNGDYISDALAAQVGGLGMAPGVNMSDSLAFFEATHGTAPQIAGKDKANPCSLILSGALMLEHIGWFEAANIIYNAVDKTLEQRKVTQDLAAQMPGSTCVGSKEFGEILGMNL